MKVKTKTLSSFLKKALMSESQQISESILSFEKEGLKINANSPNQQSRSMAWLKTTAFKEYEEIGKVGMNDLANVVKVLDRFGDEVSLTKEGNLLTVKGEGKKVEIELVSETFLSTDTGEPELEFEQTFNTTASKLGEIIKDISTNKDTVLTFETDEKKVRITNTGKYKFTFELAAPSCKPGVKLKLGEPFVHAVNNLDGNLEFSIKSDYPVKIKESTETGVITLIVAPRVDDEE